MIGGLTSGLRVSSNPSEIRPVLFVSPHASIPAFPVFNPKIF